MGYEKFQFQPRFALIMANLKTAREMREVLENEGKTDIQKFMGYVKDKLNDKVPEIKSWKFDSDKFSINFYPSNKWKVLDDEYVTITIQFDWGMSIFNPNNDPWVGLYVPEKWSQRKVFKEKLLKALPKEFINDWDKPEDEWPIWAYVAYEDYSNGDVFDTEAFVDDVGKLVGKLIKIKGLIDDTIENVEGKQKSNKRRDTNDIRK